MLNHLAAPRMAAVEKFFQTSSKSDLLGCYAWCQAVSSGLLPILGDFEVTLRNMLHVSLSRHYGNIDSFNWMMLRPNPAAPTNPRAKPLPACHKMNPKTIKDIEIVANKIKRRRGLSASPDDVVAALPFGFWEQIINSLDHPSHPPGLQSAILSRVFPYAPDLSTCPYGDPAFKQRVVNLLSLIRDVRNRIGHHDSIWAVPEFNTHGKVGLVPRRPRHTIASSRLLAARIAWLSGWIDPSITQHIQNSDHWWSFHALLDRQALATYRATGGRIGTYGKVLHQISKNPHFGKARYRNQPIHDHRSKILSGRLKTKRFHY